MEIEFLNFHPLVPIPNFFGAGWVKDFAAFPCLQCYVTDAGFYAEYAEEANTQLAFLSGDQFKVSASFLINPFLFRHFLFFPLDTTAWLHFKVCPTLSFHTEMIFPLESLNLKALLDHCASAPGKVTQACWDAAGLGDVEIEAYPYQTYAYHDKVMDRE